MRRTILVLLSTLAVLAATTIGASGAGSKLPPDPGLFLNILPPGQGTSVTATSGNPPPHSDDQREMYASLLTAGDLTDGDLPTYFKPESFDVAEDQVERTEQPKDGVQILRDQFGVPHIYGDTRADAMFGAGYVSAEDRLFMMDVLRHYGRGRTSELLGPSDENLDMDRQMYRVAGYSEEELRQQVERLTRYGKIGQLVIDDGRAFVDGVNARIQEDTLDPTKMPAEYPALQITPEPWKPTDLVAVATLIQAIFASGGGSELLNAEFYDEAVAKLGQARADKLFTDMRELEDPEAPVTADARFPYLDLGATDPASVAIPDRGSVVPFDPISTDPPSGGGSGSSGSGSNATPSKADLDPIGAVREALAAKGISFPGAMSNWLGVTADRAAAGHPTAVMGPQVGYYVPEILMEIDMHAPVQGDTPGLDARGATFPGISLYVLLGRGPDFAWSATSGESDLVDVRAEKLCRPRGGTPTMRSVHYLFHGQCVKMYLRTDEWVSKPTAGGTGEPKTVKATVQRTVHGPVIARGRVGGAPVAYALQRSTFFGELDSALPFVRLNSDLVTSGPTFQQNMNLLTGSFNWLYVDDRDLAYFHSGLYPIRPQGVSTSFPTWGTGQWEWQGFEPMEAHPQALNPAKGWIDSWNNKPARGWHAADNKWDYGTVHRVEMLSDRLGPVVEAGNVTPSDVVEVMADAASVDLRGQEDLPALLGVIGDDPSLQPYLDILSSWVASGAHRIDRDGDGEYDDQAAVALMDEWWPRLIPAMFDPELSGLYGLTPMTFDDHPSPTGSAFLDGYYGYVEKTARMALGETVPAPYGVLRCGDGTLDGCRAALVQSLQDAIDALGSDPSSWDACESCEAIHFTSVGLASVPDIPWQNRPTFQQVVQVTEHRPR